MFGSCTVDEIKCGTTHVRFVCLAIKALLPTHSNMTCKTDKL